MNTKVREIDDIICDWNDQVEDNTANVSQEELEAMITRHQKERKWMKVSSVVMWTFIAYLMVYTIPLADHWLVLVCQILLLFAIFYFAVRYVHTSDKLKMQDCSPTIDEFINLRRKIAIEGHSYLKSGRYIIYPIIVGLNIGHILSEGVTLEGKWYVANIIFSLVVSVITINSLEKSIREYRDKVQALS